MGYGIFVRLGFYFGIAGLIGWMAWQLDRAHQWQTNVITATSVAVDARDMQGRSVDVAKDDVVDIVLALGQAVIETRLKTEIARAQDAQNALERERASTLKTQGIVHDYNLKIEAARAAAAVRRGAARPTGGMQPETKAASIERGGRGANLPALPDTARAADEHATQVRLSDPTQLTEGDALICAEQAIGYDALRTWVKAQSAIADEGAGL